MEPSEVTDKPVNELFISHEIKTYLRGISKWGKFLSVVGFIGIGIFVLLGIVFSLMGNMICPYGSIPHAYYIGWMGYIYVVFGLLYFFPTYYLMRASNNLRKGLVSTNQHFLTVGFRNLKSVFKFFGVMTIVICSIYPLGAVVAFAFFMFKH